MSVTVTPRGFGGAVQDRRIIAFFKNTNKDQETQTELVSGMTIESEGKAKVCAYVLVSVACCTVCVFVEFIFICTCHFVCSNVSVSVHSLNCISEHCFL